MKLYLVQHGEAVTKDVDPDRPLSEQGFHDVEKMALFLQQGGISVGRILHSGKRRAEQTAQVLAAAIMPEGQPESVEGIKPNDDVTAFGEKLADLHDDTLVVGHLPFMGRLVAWLITGNDEFGMVTYQPVSVVCLEQQRGKGWTLEWMVRPELLEDQPGDITGRQYLKLV